MTIYDNIFPMGLGTNRFNVKSFDDEEGIERATNLVVHALEAGISYVDVAPSYSKGVAGVVCRKAFSHTKATRNVTVKSAFTRDQTADDALRRVDDTLKLFSLPQAFSFVHWDISSWEMFLALTQKGNLYDGAIKAKEQGLVEHITFSTHAPPKEIIKMIETDLFEGVTISLNVLNAPAMKPVLDAAEKHNIGVVVMNPLAGGLIGQNQEYYRFLMSQGDASPAQAALRYVAAHPAVKIVLSGLSSEAELQENIAAFRTSGGGGILEPPEERIARVDSKLSQIEGFCTGCHYCDGCPQGINIYEHMQSYNTTLFPYPQKLYGKTDPDFLRTHVIAQRLRQTFGFLPTSAENPCVACGRCEAKCTAHLPIIKRLKELYGLFAKSCFGKEEMLQRLRELVGDKRKLAFYPGGGYTAYVIELLHEAFPHEEFEIHLFDSNPNVWGNILAGYTVQNPIEIPNVAPEVVIVSNYNYGEAIYIDLKNKFPSSIPILKLHKPDDMPWAF